MRSLTPQPTAVWTDTGHGRRNRTLLAKSLLLVWEVPGALGVSVEARLAALYM
jgi:hypothetical protein